MTFTEKVAVVTGAGQGIGYEICRQLALRGAAVLLNDRDPELAECAAEEIRWEGGNCLAFPGDVSQIETIEAMVQTCVKEFGKLDIAIANAGITHFGDFWAFQPEQFEEVMGLNMRGTFFLAQIAAKQMRAQGTGGSLLLMSSVVGTQAHKNLGAYAMTKGGIQILAKNLVVELSPYGITCNAIGPGATTTERTLHDPDYDRIWSGITPMGRPASPIDIAEAALFLVSPQARHVTGQTLIVDGGWTAVSVQPE